MVSDSIIYLLWKEKSFNFLQFQIEHICDLPHTKNENGVQCEAAFERYHYNLETKSCDKVTYGGCGATANNFNTQEECEKACAGHKH